MTGTVSLFIRYTKVLFLAISSASFGSNRTYLYCTLHHSDFVLTFIDLYFVNRLHPWQTCVSSHAGVMVLFEYKVQILCNRSRPLGCSWWLPYTNVLINISFRQVEVYKLFYLTYHEGFSNTHVLNSNHWTKNKVVLYIVSSICRICRYFTVCIQYAIKHLSRPDLYQ